MEQKRRFKYNMFKTNRMNIALITLSLVLSCGSNGTETDYGPTDFSMAITVVGANAGNPNGAGSGMVQV